MFARDIAVCCFAQEFKKGENQRVDYFKCSQCNINWICKNCAETCHKGHPIATYMLKFQPSYGCCYCSTKTDNCKIKK